MKKKILIALAAVVVLAVIGIGVLFSMDWGGRTSTVEKTEVIAAADSTDQNGNVHPSMDDLMGNYSVSTKTGKAELLFEIDGMKETQGAFEEFEASLTVNDDFTTSELNVNIVSASLNTENGMRDEHLKGEEYFNVEEFKEITFNASDISFDNENYHAEGELNFIGATNPLTIVFKHIGGQDLESGTHIEVFEGNFDFDRTQYGMVEESGIGNVAHLSFYVEMELN